MKAIRVDNLIRYIMRQGLPVDRTELLNFIANENSETGSIHNRTVNSFSAPGKGSTVFMQYDRDLFLQLDPKSFRDAVADFILKDENKRSERNVLEK